MTDDLKTLGEDRDPLRVEWHTIHITDSDGHWAEYRVSFDRRTDASRFIILRGPGNLVGHGLIDGALRLSRTDTLDMRQVVWDDEPDADVARVGQIMLRLWHDMAARLRARRL